MTRKLAFTVLLLAALILSFASLAQAAPAHEAVFKVGRGYYTADGQQNWIDAAPFIQDGRTYVPVRYLAYALGVNENDVKYDNGTVTLALNGKTLTMVEGSKALKVDNIVTNMDVAPIIKDGRTYLPARWVAEAFGYKVDWFDPIQWVLIRDQATWKAAQPMFRMNDGSYKPYFRSVAFAPYSNKAIRFEQDEPKGWEAAIKNGRATDAEFKADQHELTLPGVILVQDVPNDAYISVKNLLLALNVPQGAVHWDEESQTLLVECDHIYRIDSMFQSRAVMDYVWMRPGEKVIHRHYTNAPEDVDYLTYDSDTWSFEQELGRVAPGEKPREEYPNAIFSYDPANGLVANGRIGFIASLVYFNEMDGNWAGVYGWNGMEVIAIR